MRHRIISSPRATNFKENILMSTHPQITYSDALNQGLSQAMELDDGVFVMGQLVDYSPGVFGTTNGLVEKFGIERVRDFPVSESAMTSAAIGASILGMRPVLVHHRLDFMIYSMDAILNWMALWRFKSNGECSLPLVIRAIVGKGWGQGPQHSKSLHSWFSNIPGLQVAIPATAFDAKGLLMEAIFGQNPVIMIEHRSLFSLKDTVPEMPYRVRFGKADVRKIGIDFTLVAIGVMVPFAMRVAEGLSVMGVDAEVIDLRTLWPLDTDTVCQSVRKTRRICVLDPSWRSFGASAEIITSVVENLGLSLKSTPLRITYPDSHTPMSSTLEDEYYPREEDVINQIKAWVK